MPDAVYARPGPTWRERNYQPRHAPVWIRRAGAWREGLIRRWVLDPAQPGWWECVIEVDGRTARYEYHEQAIRPRHGDEPPPPG